mmetsp:Transcript_3063/g.9551  ORF Transcript_3063/g.9551 Transcript_3063/m.9551 type:complete len:308 (+) Transcript_3063:338-1261(+)
MPREATLSSHDGSGSSTSSHIRFRTGLRPHSAAGIVAPQHDVAARNTSHAVQRFGAESVAAFQPSSPGRGGFCPQFRRLGGWAAAAACPRPADPLGPKCSRSSCRCSSCDVAAQSTPESAHRLRLTEAGTTYHATRAAPGRDGATITPTRTRSSTSHNAAHGVVSGAAVSGCRRTRKIPASSSSRCELEQASLSSPRCSKVGRSLCRRSKSPSAKLDASREASCRMSPSATVAGSRSGTGSSARPRARSTRATVHNARSSMDGGADDGGGGCTLVAKPTRFGRTSRASGALVSPSVSDSAPPRFARP